VSGGATLSDRKFLLQAASAVGVAALTAAALWYLFGRGDAVAVAAPAPTSNAVAAECARLTKGAPQAVGGQSRRSTDPASSLTAAWGDPAIVLRCGVPEPTMLKPGSANYNPTADATYLNGVSWLIEQASNGYKFTAYQRAVYVEVDVPAAYQPETNALVDLSQDVINNIPRNDGTSGADIAPLATSSP
jgi:uncharacterized protein DUF3515